MVSMFWMCETKRVAVCRRNGNERFYKYVALVIREIQKVELNEKVKNSTESSTGVVSNCVHS